MRVETRRVRIKPLRHAAAAIALGALALAFGSRIAAQSALAQLGLTEAAARNFVLGEIKSPATGRRSDIALAGTRVFLKLPASARGAAATALFAWAKAYGNSAAFKASYDAHRQSRIPSGRQYALSVDEAIKKEIDDVLAGFEQMRKGIASLPPADQKMILEKAQAAQAMLTDPEQIKARKAVLEAERAAESGNADAARREVEEQTPADPQKLFARRLREFIDATADVNFSAHTISLTGGTDGIELVDRADRQRHWMWQEAVIVGPEATAAARAAAQAWLQEIER